MVASPPGPRSLLALALVVGVWTVAACDGADEGEPAWQPWANTVVAFEPGPEAGFGDAELPGIVLGPPAGGSPTAGSLDVLSLGVGGEITLSFDGPIVDGPGPDLIVFENVFFIGDSSGEAFVEPASVSVSEDGETWHVFPCVAHEDGTWAGCAGLSPQATPAEDWQTPLDPELTGGDAFDLADLGLSEVDYVRIQDLGLGGEAPTGGFDLDAVAVVHNPSAGW